MQRGSSAGGRGGGNAGGRAPGSGGGNAGGRAPGSGGGNAGGRAPGLIGGNTGGRAPGPASGNTGGRAPGSAGDNAGGLAGSGAGSVGGGGGGGRGKPYYHHYRRNNKKDDDKKGGDRQGDNQRDVLIRRLKQNQCDCMICCERITRSQGIWNCLVCFNIFHLKCIRSWALKNAALPESSGVWRCPACQTPTTVTPNDYTCFCGKVVNPATSPQGEVAHSCHQPCLRPCKTAHSKDENFPGHPCGMLCHPGPCGPCSAFINRSCKCGRLSVPSQCSTQVGELDCGELCDRKLSCGKHKCADGCHNPPCASCPITIPVACFCGATIKSFPCDQYKEDGDNKFSCSNTCNKRLSCGNHFCPDPCHPGECAPCKRQPSIVKSCPCGRTPLTDITPFVERVNCTDPIATCGSVCKKKLPCGDGFEHFCQLNCHDSDCPPCKQSVSIRCQCGRLTERFVCSERPRPLTCVFRCNKKMTCRKHKCANLCCTMGTDDQNSHICAVPCNRTLTCGQHRCVQLCGHPRDCPPCYNASFDELSCFCGNSVLYPPVPCGAKPPPCDKPCSREQVCSHPPNHNCHPDPPCPPCMEPVSCMCIGGHKTVTVACSTPIDTISCAKICDRVLPCGHRCIRVCHGDPCTTQKCRELCQRPRQSGCGHPCSQFCHEPNPCPPPESTPCNFEVDYRCRCGLKTGRTQCPGSSGALQSLQLPCDDRCAIAERNRRLAEALQLTDVSILPQVPITVYPAFIQETVQRLPAFCLDVETAYIDLVKGLASSANGVRASHSFKPMSANFRRFIHELAPFYGCEAQSYDAEPNRNVIIYGVAGKCFLPATLLPQSFPTAFVGIPTSSRSTSPPMPRPRLAGASLVAQLPSAAKATMPMIFEKVSSDSWRASSKSAASSTAPTTAPIPIVTNNTARPPATEPGQKKRGKKQAQVSCFDETETPSTNGAGATTATLITGAGPIRFVSLATSSKNNNVPIAASVPVPDHWDDDR